MFWIIKLAVLGVLLYVASWLALLLVFAVVAAWLARNVDSDDEGQPEWREGHGGFGLYDKNESAGGTLEGGAVVLAAGLGNRELAPMVGLEAPVKPVRGQVLVCERAQPFLPLPTLHVRQTGDGGVQIGDSMENVGFNDGTSVDQLSRIAARALACFPVLANTNVVRAWGALRVMTPDGLPLYEQSTSCPGAYVVSCHSGITLASAHAGELVGWLTGGPAPGAFKSFTTERFHA